MRLYQNHVKIKIAWKLCRIQWKSDTPWPRITYVVAKISPYYYCFANFMGEHFKTTHKYTKSTNELGQDSQISPSHTFLMKNRNEKRTPHPRQLCIKPIWNKCQSRRKHFPEAWIKLSSENQLSTCFSLASMENHSNKYIYNIKIAGEGETQIIIFIRGFSDSAENSYWKLVLKKEKKNIAHKLTT